MERRDRTRVMAPPHVKLVEADGAWCSLSSRGWAEEAGCAEGEVTPAGADRCSQGETISAHRVMDDALGARMTTTAAPSSRAALAAASRLKRSLNARSLPALRGLSLLMLETRGRPGRRSHELSLEEVCGGDREATSADEGDVVSSSTSTCSWKRGVAASCGALRVMTLADRS